MFARTNTNKYYEYLHKAEKQKQSRKMIESKGLQESIPELEYEHVPLGKYQRQISKLFRDMRSIEDDTQMGGAAKKTALDSLQRDINLLYQDAVHEVRAAKEGK
ncbi:MAG: hypothetical protein JSR37_08525 [Verrucomicrobia bacterium]|nr:hypothetical protein [Verrucomicrobiota bacterium]MBS0636727.1 hypothetical protein [Verrucomicrobiota bacterium]